MQRGVGFFGLATGVLGAVACTYFVACAAEVLDGTDGDAGQETSVPSGPPTTYDSGPPANPYNDAGVPNPGPDAATDGGSEGGPVNTSCNTSGDCPGNNEHDNVKCTSHTCSLSCQGEFYDVNELAADGCEKQDSPIDKHTKDKAVAQGDKSCNDGDSAMNIDGLLLTDDKVHENPTVDGFIATVGAAQDWYTIHATGGVCTDDANFDLQMNGAKEPGCYRLTLITDKQTQACGTDNSGHCSLGNGASSYSDNSTIYLMVERICNAGKGDDGKYHISGHL